MHSQPSIQIAKATLGGHSRPWNMQCINQKSWQTLNIFWSCCKLLATCHLYSEWMYSV